MKKSIFLLLSFLSTIFLTAFPSYAQTYAVHQRLGIPPQPTIYLTAKNPSKEVEAFCLDRNKIIDGSYDYNYVIASDSKTTVTVGGRKSLSLQKAIDQKLIKVESLINLNRADFGSGIGLRFVGLKNFPVSIRIRDSIAVGEVAGPFGNLPVLEALKEPKPPVKNGSELKQDKIWEIDVDKSRLESLGYISVEQFQRDNDLSLNGFDKATKTKLIEAEDKLIARFEAVDLKVVRSDTSIKSVSDNIDLFENRVLKRTENRTRVFSSEIRQLFEKYEKFVKIDYPIIKELKEYNTELSGSLVLRVKAEIGKENFYTIYSYLGKEYEGNSISEINAFISRLSQRFENINLDLDFPSPKMMGAFKDSFEIHQIKSNLTFSAEGTTASKKVFFSNTKSFEMDGITEPLLENGNYSQTIGLKSSDPADINKIWKIKAASKIKETVVKFTNAFKTLFQKREKQSIANIIGRARRVESDMSNKDKTGLEITVSFIDEFGEIQTGKIFFGKTSEITAE